MKKFLLVFLLAFVGFFANAQTQWYKGTSYAYKYVNDYGYWTNWTDWYSCNINIKFDLTNDVITIYSNKTQVYVIYDGGERYSDSGGGYQVKFNVVDQDYDVGTVRLRIESNGNSQIYVDFANVSWVYNVVRQ